MCESLAPAPPSAAFALDPGFAPGQKEQLLSSATLPFPPLSLGRLSLQECRLALKIVLVTGRNENSPKPSPKGGERDKTPALLCPASLASGVLRRLGVAAPARERAPCVLVSWIWR